MTRTTLVYVPRVMAAASVAVAGAGVAEVFTGARLVGLLDIITGALLAVTWWHNARTARTLARLSTRGGRHG